MERSKVVLKEVSDLYKSATMSMGRWMWHNHTQWVADKARALAEKYEANTEVAYCAALLHDLGDSKYERGHEDFDVWANAKSKEILLKADFNDGEVKEILEAVRTHGSRPGNLPRPKKEKCLLPQMACGICKPASFRLSAI